MRRDGLEKARNPGHRRLQEGKKTSEAGLTGDRHPRGIQGKTGAAGQEMKGGSWDRMAVEVAAADVEDKEISSNALSEDPVR